MNNMKELSEKLVEECWESLLKDLNRAVDWSCVDCEEIEAELRANILKGVGDKINEIID